MAPKTTPPEVRFWRSVAVDEPDACWLWTGSRSRRGYGRFSLTHQKPVSATRFCYELHTGPIPAGLVVCHTCDNPPCVNPAHLWLGTRQDNVDDQRAKGRTVVGERNGRARLTEDIVREIRNDPRTHAVIAAELGVTPETVSFARRRITWPHVL